MLKINDNVYAIKFKKIDSDSKMSGDNQVIWDLK